MSWFWRNWFWRWAHHLPELTLKNSIAIAATAMLTGVVLYGAAFGIPPWVGARAGFYGDGWKCTHPGESEPVCVRETSGAPSQ